jgi:CBS domain-containing protein
MKVADVMVTNVPSLAADMTWKQAAEFFVEKGVSAAPVVDAHGKLIGVLSEKDLFRGLFPSYGEWLKNPEAYLDFEKMEREAANDAGKRTIDEVMSKNLISVDPETPVLKIGALMVARNIHQVPVVHHEKVVGMVQRGKIYMKILKRYFHITRP